MLRRDFLRLAAASSLAACVPREPAKPNVLFIAVDDMNDYVSVLGGRRGVHTPNLDRLAARGVVFTNAHCASPACHPSRTALLTGVSPATSGISRNHFREARASWRRSPALENAVTLPQHFRDHGYEAVGGGKIFHALQWTEGTENEPESWDSYFPDPLDTIPEWPLPEGFSAERNREEGRHPWFHWEPLEVDDPETSDYEVVDWAIAELEKERDRPLFLACGIFRPHMPWHVPRKYFDMYPLESLELPVVQENDLDDTHGHSRRHWHQWVLDHEQWPQALQSYLASITYADAQIGRLLDALDASGKADETVIVLWSDHGMHIGEKENWEKFTLWEESTRVPLLFAGPGVSVGTCSRPASLLDVYPTLVELCKLPQPPKEQMEGLSLVAQLADVTTPSERPAVTTFRGDNHSVRSERWRYIRYSNGDEELYDHAADPHEFTNLAADPGHADTIADLAAWLPKTIAPSPYNEGFGEF